MPCRRMHGPPVRRSPYASFIYTVSGGSAAALGQVPENTFALCPADGTGFLSVMQHMFCETVVLYTYEDGALHEQTLLYEAPVDQLPKNASTPLDEMGTMSSHGSAPTRSTIFPVCPSPAFRPAPMRILSLCSKQKQALPEFLCKTRVCLQQSPAPRRSRALLGINPPCRMPAQRAGKMGEGIESLL